MTQCIITLKVGRKGLTVSKLFRYMESKKTEDIIGKENVYLMIKENQLSSNEHTTYNRIKETNP